MTTYLNSEIILFVSCYESKNTSMYFNNYNLLNKTPNAEKAASEVEFLRHLLTI